MAIDPRRGLTRRALLALLGAAAWPMAHAAARGESDELLASWAEAGRYHAGRLSVGTGGAQVRSRIELPTRAHGLALEADGAVLVAARRPGDWLLRWRPAGGEPQWHWVDDDRRLNGHVLPSTDGRFVWTAETDQADASGLIGLRDARTLEKTGEWATRGMDPHEMLVLPEALGDVPAGALLVANGGIPTQSETGRSHRDLSRMDPSLVALDPAGGTLLGQWRLHDPRLSVRHLAWDPVSRRVGIALQAEHDDEAARRDAPLLATWDGSALKASPPMPGALGYGGDICARAGGGFWLSATRANALLGLAPDGVIADRIALPSAGALAAQAGHAWAGGAAAMWDDGQRRDWPAALQLDNHWVSARA
ncbi:MAG TPA: DUF1513 domain-containing protein [Hydrogenophaga sp.]|uniref:DUF1513 domain-containing protein n=1 Tax=Hydrogenophaga sp. TaxID=1904254 RepID=UPI002C2BBC38|nr:DUF1513 domain-containing protein [Hydrogenophaga sp.]HSX91533.1 DUF1513 domain-containing protein [Hydrogenophaga sp.]